MEEIVNIKIIVATHKKYRMPDNKMYFPLFVGAEGKVDKEGNPLDLGISKDNTGDNISTLNLNFCELTGLYWAWKNVNADYLGLVHYRRHFAVSSRTNADPFDSILTEDELMRFLPDVRLFVPRKRHYFIETVYSHYEHTHYSAQLDETEKVLKELYPEYLDNYYRVIRRSYAYMFNMMIMEKSLFDDYCSWLFDILFSLQGRLSLEGLSEFQARFYGRISEILFNVWIDYKICNGQLKKNEIKELPCIYMEKVNWVQKGKAFLEAKFFGKKYEKSF